MIGGLLNLFGTMSSNIRAAQIAEDDRKFQASENEKTRQYNLNLAKYQNAENQAQWQREANYNEAMMDKQNAYSSPSAQMARYAAAGLNPNLIYGQSNVSSGINSSSAAGSMTGGAAATPVDAAATSERHGRQSYSSAMADVGRGLMNLPMYAEEVRAKRLDNQEREIDLWNKQQDKGVREALRRVATDPKSLENLLTSPDFQLGSQYETRRKLLELQQMNYGLRQSRWNDMLRDETFEDELHSLAARYQVDYEKAQEFMTNLELMVDANAADYRRRAAIQNISDFFKDDLTLKEFVQGAFKLILDYVPLKRK